IGSGLVTCIRIRNLRFAVWCRVAVWVEVYKYQFIDCEDDLASELIANLTGECNGCTPEARTGDVQFDNVTLSGRTHEIYLGNKLRNQVGIAQLYDSVYNGFFVDPTEQRATK